MEKKEEEGITWSNQLTEKQCKNPTYHIKQ